METHNTSRNKRHVNGSPQNTHGHTTHTRAKTPHTDTSTHRELTCPLENTTHTRGLPLHPNPLPSLGPTHGFITNTRIPTGHTRRDLTTDDWVRYPWTDRLTDTPTDTTRSRVHETRTQPTVRVTVTVETQTATCRLKVPEYGELSNTHVHSECMFQTDSPSQ